MKEKKPSLIKCDPAPFACEQANVLCIQTERFFAVLHVSIIPKKYPSNLIHQSLSLYSNLEFWINGYYE